MDEAVHVWGGGLWEVSIFCLMLSELTTALKKNTVYLKILEIKIFKVAFYKSIKIIYFFFFTIKSKIKGFYQAQGQLKKLSTTTLRIILRRFKENQKSWKSDGVK